MTRDLPTSERARLAERERVSALLPMSPSCARSGQRLRLFGSL